MRAILVRVALMLCLSAGTAVADPINVSVFDGPSSAISDFSISGNNITFDLALGMSGPLFLLVKGLDARENYQVSVNMSSASSWTNLTAEILNPARGWGNADDPNPQPGYVPAGFSTSTNYDGYSFAQGSGLERSFLTAGGTGFAVFADELSHARDLLRFSGSGIGCAVAVFGLRVGGLGQSFLIRLDPGNQLATPEPGAMLLVGSGLVAIARVVRKRRRRQGSQV
jgi:PEP-CTERM motif